MTHPTVAAPPPGRDRDLSRLSTALTATRDGRGAVVLVGGEAGIGKTWLLSRFAAYAAERGAVVVTGACLPMGDTALPLAPIVDLVRGLERHPDPIVRRAVSTAPAEVRMLVSEDRRAATGAASPPDDAGRLRRFLGLRDLLERLSAERQLVVAIEDSHWADAASRDVLLYLATEVVDLPVMLVVTYRSDEIDRHHPLRSVLVELTRRPHVERLELAPLDRDAAAAVVAGVLGQRPTDELTDRLQRRAEGNPFYLEQLAAAVRDGVDGLPEQLRDLLLMQVERVPAPVQQVLRAVAAFARPVDHAMLEAVVGDDTGTGGELDEHLRAAVDSGVLTTTADGGYVLRHALLTEAVAAMLLPGERMRLHARVAQVLSEWGGASHMELAHHWSQTGSDIEALRASVPAAIEAASLGSYAEALRHAERALALARLVPEGDGLLTPDRPGFLAAAAEAAAFSGDSVRAGELVREALAEVDEPVRQGRLHERLARYAWLSGDLAAADAAFEQAVALVPADPPSADRAIVLASHARHLMLHLDSAAAVERGTEALEVARAVEDQATEVRVRCSIATAMGDLGDVHAGIEELAATKAAALDLDLIEEVVRASTNLAALLCYAGRYEDALDEARNGAAYCRQHGLDGQYGGGFVANEAATLWCAGHWDDLWGLLVETPLPGDRAAQQWGNISAAALLAVRGDSDRAQEYLEAAGRLAPQHPDSLLHFGHVRLLLLEAAGDVDGAVAVLEEAREWFAGGLTARPMFELVAAGLAVLADAAAAADARRDEVAAAELRAFGDELAEHARATAHDTLQHPDPVGQLHPFVRMIEAQLSRLRGERDAQPWRTAVAAWEEAAQPYPLAWSRLRLAETLLATGDDTSGVADLVVAAHETAARLGAARLAEEVELLARRARIRLAPRTPRPLHAVAPAPDEEDAGALLGLTGRELEVLELVALGRTNPEIGEQLYISEKTASVHVSNILRKLGVSNRVEAAAVAHRVGLGRGRAGGEAPAAGLVQTLGQP